jgi:hypothetical protein
MGVYLAALAGATLSAADAGGGAEEALLVPVVLAVMHTAHGAGMLIGAIRYGPPLAAVARMLGMRRLTAWLAPGPLPVNAPSLAGVAAEAGRPAERSPA